MTQSVKNTQYSISPCWLYYNLNPTRGQCLPSAVKCFLYLRSAPPISHIRPSHFSGVPLPLLMSALPLLMSAPPTSQKCTSHFPGVLLPILRTVPTAAQIYPSHFSGDRSPYQVTHLPPAWDFLLPLAQTPGRRDY